MYRSWLDIATVADSFTQRLVQHTFTTHRPLPDQILQGYCLQLSTPVVRAPAASVRVNTGAEGPQKKQRRSGPTDVSTQICRNYNNGKAPCATATTCVNGRRHECDICKGPHARVLTPACQLVAKGK